MPCRSPRGLDAREQLRMVVSSYVIVVQVQQHQSLVIVGQRFDASKASYWPVRMEQVHSKRLTAMIASRVRSAP